MSILLEEVCLAKLNRSGELSETTCMFSIFQEKREVFPHLMIINNC